MENFPSNFTIKRLKINHLDYKTANTTFISSCSARDLIIVQKKS